MYFRVLWLIRQRKVSVPIERNSLSEQCWRSRVQLSVTCSFGLTSLNLWSIKVIKIELCVCPNVKSKRPALSEQVRVKQLPYLSRNSWSLRSYEIFKFRVNTMHWPPARPILWTSNFKTFARSYAWSLNVWDLKPLFNYNCFMFIVLNCQDRDSVVSVTTGLRTGRCVVRITEGDERFSLLLIIQLCEPL
jgi:hypothetical protein